MSKIIKFDLDAKTGLQNGVNALADATTCTLGPFGRNVMYFENGEVRSTKDGVTVAKNITLEDPIENMGAEVVKQAAIKSANMAGDGTTTTTLLAQSLINEGLKNIKKGSNAVEIKKGIDLATEEVVEALKEKYSFHISDPDQIKQIATISANNDLRTGELISLSLEKVGKEGVVTIEESKTGETYLEVVEGMQFNRGYKSPYFVTNNDTMMAVLDNPYILLVNEKISTAKSLLPFLEVASNNNKSILIVAEDIEGEALATLIVNKARGTIKACAVKAPEFGDRRTTFLEDLASITGATVLSKDKGYVLERMTNSDKILAVLGAANGVNVERDSTTVIDGKGDIDNIKHRAEEIKKQLENKSLSPFEIEKLQERLAKLTSGVSIIYVGGSNEIEIKEYKDRVEDALFAAKAAISEGIVPGGGVALLHARKHIVFNKKDSDFINIGKRIVYEACSKPFTKILMNAGINEKDCYELISKIEKNTNSSKGYNLKTGKICHMLDEGIIDPLKVTRLAIQNASSVAGTLLITEAVVYQKPENKKQDTENDIMSQFGGM